MAINFMFYSIHDTFYAVYMYHDMPFTKQFTPKHISPKTYDQSLFVTDMKCVPTGLGFNTVMDTSMK